MGKYSYICIKYENLLLEHCHELKTSNVNCEMLGQIYTNCLDFKKKKEQKNEKEQKKEMKNEK